MRNSKNDIVFYIWWQCFCDASLEKVDTESAGKFTSDKQFFNAFVFNIKPHGLCVNPMYGHNYNYEVVDQKSDWQVQPQQINQIYEVGQTSKDDTNDAIMQKITLHAQYLLFS